MRSIPVIFVFGALSLTSQPGDAQVSFLIDGVSQLMGTELPAAVQFVDGAGLLSGGEKQPEYDCKKKQNNTTPCFHRTATCYSTEMGPIKGTFKCERAPNSFLVMSEDSAMREGPFTSLVPFGNQAGTELYRATETRPFPVLINESAKRVVDGNLLGCKEFSPKSSELITCHGKDGSSDFRVSDVREMEVAHVKVSDISKAIGLDVCGLTIESIAAGKNDSWAYYQSKIFETGSGQKMQVYKHHDQQKGSTCTMPPRKEACTRIIVTAESRVCLFKGETVYKLTDERSEADMAGLAKKYFFGNREVIPMKEVFQKITGVLNPLLTMEKSKALFGAPLIKVRAAGGSPASSSSGSR